MILIHGILTTTAPLHTSAGSKGLRLSRDGRVSSRDDEGIPIKSTVTAPLSVRGRYYGDVPVFPATGVIGALRRNAAKRVRAAITADNKKVSLPAYYAIQNGHAPGAQLGGSISAKAYDTVREHIFFGLFGGGSLRNASNFIQCDLVPVIEPTIDLGLVPQKFSDLVPTSGRGPLEPWQLVDYRVMRKTDDIARGRDAGADVDMCSSDSSEDEGARHGTEGAVAYQVITTGMPLYYKAMLRSSTTLEQRGLFLLALQDLLDAGQLGGRAHLGWGGVNAQRFRYVDGKERHDLFEAVADDEGIAQYQPTKAFQGLTKPAVKALQAIEKAPADAREALMELLNV